MYKMRNKSRTKWDVFPLFHACSTINGIQHINKLRKRKSMIVSVMAGETFKTI